MQCENVLHSRKRVSSLTYGPFTHTISVPMSVTIKVCHCAKGDGPFDRQIGFGTHSVRKCNFDGDGDMTTTWICSNLFT